MAFTIQASKDGQMVTTTRLGPTVTVAKARALIKEGWDVHVTGADGRKTVVWKIDPTTADAPTATIKF